MESGIQLIPLATTTTYQHKVSGTLEQPVEQEEFAQLRQYLFDRFGESVLGESADKAVDDKVASVSLGGFDQKDCRFVDSIVRLFATTTSCFDLRHSYANQTGLSTN